MKTNPYILIKNLNDKIEARGNNVCQKAGLTLAHFRILAYLLLHSETIVTQRELELEFKVSHPTISGILKRMEKNELVTTKILLTEKRKQVFVTQKGKEAMDKMKEFMNQDHALLDSVFSEEELEQFGEYLTRMLNLLS